MVPEATRDRERQRESESSPQGNMYSHVYCLTETAYEPH